MLIWLVELKFAILFLLNALYMMHFVRILTILLHFLVGAPDRLYFTILQFFAIFTILSSMGTFGSKKEPIPNFNILFLKRRQGLSKALSD
jgi:hypothetical protein